LTTRFSKSGEEFEAYYEQHIKSLVVDIESERKAGMAKVHKGLPIPIGISIVAVLLFLFDILSAQIAFFMIAGSFGLFYFARIAALKKQLQKKIFDKVFPYVVRFIDENLSYSPGSFISEQEFVSSGIYRGNIDRFSGNALVNGFVGDTQIRFSDLLVVDVRKDSKGRSYDHIVFNGLFIALDFNKNFNGKTIVYTERGSFTNECSRDLPVVKLDSPDFEKRYVVRGSDLIAAHYILTPSFMERLSTFLDQSRYGPFFSFMDGKMVVALSSKKDVFGFDVHRTIDFNVVRSFFLELNEALSVVDEFNLNLRIFNKS
jgi:hypothetical protein